MDPNANLAEQRRIIASVGDGSAQEEDLERLVDLAEALDQWLSNGGFPPHDWRFAEGES